jgi:hypothetical protein
VHPLVHVVADTGAVTADRVVHVYEQVVDGDLESVPAELTVITDHFADVTVDISHKEPGT